MTTVSAPQKSVAAPTAAVATPLAGALALLLIGNMALAVGPWFVRLADCGPVSAGFWRLILPLPIHALLARRAVAIGSRRASRPATAPRAHESAATG